MQRDFHAFGIHRGRGYHGNELPLEQLTDWTNPIVNRLSGQTGVCCWKVCCFVYNIFIVHRRSWNQKEMATFSFIKCLLGPRLIKVYASSERNVFSYNVTGELNAVNNSSCCFFFFCTGYQLSTFWSGKIWRWISEIGWDRINIIISELHFRTLIIHN